MTESPDRREFKYLPLSLRLGTVGGVATPLVLRGTPLPATRSDTFTTAVDNQTTVEVSFTIGERPLSRDNIPMGQFTIKEIPPLPAGTVQVRVTFAVDTSCAVAVVATVDNTELRIEQTFDPPFDMSDDKLQQLMQEAERTSEQDEQNLRRIESVNHANALIRRAEESLSRTASTPLSTAIAALGLSLQAGDSATIREKSDELEKLLTPSFDVLGGDLFSTFFAPQRPSAPRKRQAVTPRRTVQQPQVVQSVNQSHSLGKIFGGGAFTLDPSLCFVLMPFAERYQPLYEDHIRPVVEAAGLRCQRADEIPATNLITWDIWERVNRARFLIAELTGQNPNVFYELGLAHALGKDVILVTQSMEFVPFDLKAIRCIVYEFTPRGTSALTQALRATIDALIKTG